MQKHVVILGGGVAGCAAALAIHALGRGFTLTIVEKSDPGLSSSHPRIGETIQAHVVVLLQRLGLWQSFLQCDFLPAYGTAAAWGESEPYCNESIASPYGHGWHVDRVRFDQWLVTQVKSRGIEYLTQSQLNESEYRDGKWRCEIRSVGTESDTKIDCDFIIDATGRQAIFSRKHGAKRIFDDKLIAMYRFLKDDRTCSSEVMENNEPIYDTCTLIESHNAGWWYSAYLPNNRWVVSFMCDADLAKEEGFKQPQKWLELLKESPNTYRRLAPRLQELNAAENTDVGITLTAAHSQCLDFCVGEAWLAVGDAASAYDPLSSLGIFKAFRTAIYASYAISDYLFPIASPHSSKLNQVSRKALEKYQHVVTQEYKSYRIKQREYYEEEQRFDTPFWERRCESSLREMTEV